MRQAIRTRSLKRRGRATSAPLWLRVSRDLRQDMSKRRTIIHTSRTATTAVQTGGTRRSTNTTGQGEEERHQVYNYVGRTQDFIDSMADHPLTFFSLIPPRSQIFPSRPFFFSLFIGHLLVFLLIGDVMLYELSYRGSMRRCTYCHHPLHMHGYSALLAYMFILHYSTTDLRANDLLAP